MNNIFRRFIKWFKDNYDQDLYFYYDDENILKVSHKKGGK